MPIYNNDLIDNLLETINQAPEHFAIFVGSGMSAPLFPTWKSLLELLVEELSSLQSMSEETINEMRQLISIGKLIDVADYCRLHVGSNVFRDFMEKHIDFDFDVDQIPGPYKQLIMSDIKTIVTTNYDRIPEVIGGTRRVYHNKNTSELNRASRSNSRFIYKLHGCISTDDSIIFSSQDYAKIRNEKLIQQYMSSLFSTKSFLFLGFSFDDPHLDIILSNLKHNQNSISTTHYALINTSSTLQAEILERKYSLKIIKYTPDDTSHPEVGEVVNIIDEFIRGINERNATCESKANNDDDPDISGSTPDEGDDYFWLDDADEFDESIEESVNIMNEITERVLIATEKSKENTSRLQNLSNKYGNNAPRTLIKKIASSMAKDLFELADDLDPKNQVLKKSTTKMITQTRKVIGNLSDSEMRDSDGIEILAAQISSVEKTILEWADNAIGARESFGDLRKITRNLKNAVDRISAVFTTQANVLYTLHKDLQDMRLFLLRRANTFMIEEE